MEIFYPIRGKLKEDNCWVIMSKKVSWKEIEKDYAKAKSACMAFGALIIKERLNISD